jgi:leader peptidase (prepilin peptidase) / N-methyltransferase
VTVTTIAVSAAAGLVAGALWWRWLLPGGHRIPTDEPRLDLAVTWTVVPAAGVVGGLAGVLADLWLVTTAWVYLVGGVGLAWVDLDVHRIPDRVLRWWVPALMVTLALAAVTTGWRTVGTAVTAAVATTVLFLILAIVGSLGLGDVKLAGATGLALGALGWPAVVTGVVAAFAVGGLAAVVMLFRGAGRGTRLAFGPAIVAGAAVAIAWTASSG